MIIPREPNLTAEQVAEIQAIVHEFGCTITPIPGQTRSVYAIKGDERQELMINRLEGLAYVSRVETIQSPYKLMDRKSGLSGHSIRIAGKTLGQELFLCGGQCTIDPRNPNLFLETAAAMKEAGVDAIRGGVWKPRTSPHTYQGSSEAIHILMRAREETGLPVNTEVMDEEQLLIALKAGVDMIQIGARNALNYSLLKKVGEHTRNFGIPVLLKRGIHMGPIDEFICAAEYIVAGGNPNVMLCPRGTLPSLDGYRNHPDESITPLLKLKSWAPVVVDPSHAVGRATYVPHAALAAIAYGADGLVIESHVDPKKGIGDDPKQAVSPKVLAKIVTDARSLFQTVRKYQASYLTESVKAS